jgi:hypothetical protein
MNDFQKKLKQFALPLIFIFLVAAFLVYFMKFHQAEAQWTALGGGDHGGADWTPANGSTIAGVHTNIGTFTIPAGYTVYVKGVEPATTVGALRRKTYVQGVKSHDRSLVENTVTSELYIGNWCVGGQCWNFSTRYTGQILTTGNSGTYWFHCWSDDGCRVWVNGVLVINDWGEWYANWVDGSIWLNANTWYDIVIDYFQGPGDRWFDIDWTPAGGTRGDIPASNMRYYNEPPSLSYGSVEIQARAINIAGTLMASGAGYGGGGGGGGGGCVWAPGSSGAGWFGIAGGPGGGGGSVGHPQYGWPGYGGWGGSVGGSPGADLWGGGGGGGGAGPFGGNGGNGGSPTYGDATACASTPGGSGSAGQPGGYAVRGGQGDASIDESVNIGSGGGGGGGGAPGGACSFGGRSDASCSCNVAYGTPGGAGGAGGAGGGAVKLIAYTGTGSISVSGSIVTTGVYGGNGLGGGCWGPSQNNAAGGNAVPGSGWSGGGAGAAGPPPGGNGGQGGGGAGGGVLLKGKTVSVTGSINALGAGSVSTNGGTVKIFYESGSWVGISAGRLYTKQLPPSDPPTNLAGTPLSETTIRWTWNDNSSTESSYKMYDASTGAELYTFAANTTSFDETGRVPGINYSRYVKACNAAGCSLASNTATTSTTLNAPTGFTGSQLTETSIRWSWTDNSGAESGYRVLRVSDGFNMSGNLPANTMSWEETTGITPGNSYGRYAQAFVGSATANSNTATVTPILYAPTLLSGAAVSGDSTALDWTFQDNSTQETEYRFYSYTSANCASGETLKFTTTLGAGSTTGSRTIRETGLSGSTTYWRRVSAYRSGPPAVESAKSNCAEATTGVTYATQGTLESAVYDSQKAGGVAFNFIMWRGTLSPGTSVDLQIASSNSPTGPWTFVGPQCTTTSYYTNQPNIQQRINPQCHTGHRYFRYKIYLNGSGETTPVVDDVVLGWSP